MGKNPSKSVQFKGVPSDKGSKGAPNVSDKELEFLSEEELERQALEVNRHLELLKARRAAASKDQVNLADLDKATDAYLKSKSPENIPGKALTSPKRDKIHEAIRKFKGEGWVNKRKASFAASKSVSEQRKISTSTDDSSVERDVPVSPAEPMDAEDPAPMDEEGVSEKSAPQAETPSIEEIPASSDKEAIPVEKAPISVEKESSPLETENSPVVDKSSSENKDSVAVHDASEEDVINDFLNSDCVSSPIIKSSSGLEDPSPANPQSHMSQKEKVADPEFEELLEQVDHAVEQESELRIAKKRAMPSRVSKRITEMSSNPPSGVDTEEVEIIEPAAKKPKVQKSQLKKDSKRKESSKEKKKQQVEGVTVDGIWFHSEEASDRWKLISDRKVIAEGFFEESKWIIPEITERLREAGLLSALRSIKPFSEQLIREFVVNIPEEFGNTMSPDYGSVKVRGKVILLSPVVINQLLHINPEATKPKISNWNEVAQMLTNGKLRKWSGLSMDSKPLTSFYALLHSICIKNWMPVSHRTTLSKQMAGLIFHIGQGVKVNLGEYIFDQLASQSISKTPIHPIGHPSTIQQLILLQAPEIINKAEALTPIKPFLADWKLFSNDHHVDTVVPRSIKDSLSRHAQGITKKGKPAKSAKKSMSVKSSESSTLFWLKKHLKSIEAVRKDIISQIVILELQQSDNLATDEEEPSNTDSEEDY